MENLKYKNRPPFQSDEMDAAVKTIGIGNLKTFSQLIKGEQVTTSTFYHYHNKMVCYLYFDNDIGVYEVEALTDIPTTTIIRHSLSYEKDFPGRKVNRKLTPK